MRTFIVFLFVYFAFGTVLSLTSCGGDGDCSSGEQCRKVSSSCSKGFCTCKSGYSKTSSSCKRERKIDESCSSNDICSTIGSECSSGKCKCKSGHKLSPSKKRCFPDSYKLIGESCTPNLHCVGNSICSSSKCTCPAGMKTSSSYPKEECIPLAKSKGESCSSSGDCSNESNLSCIKSKCECATNYVWKSVQSFGETRTVCLHKDAKVGLEKGNSCTENNNSNGKYCSSGLVCVTCPGETQQKCQPSSASYPRINSILFGVSIIILGMIINQ